MSFSKQDGTPAAPLEINMKEAVKVLYPQSNSSSTYSLGSKSSYKSSSFSSYSNTTSLQLSSNAQSRFSSLLLEHGEVHLQDWAVVASSSTLSPPPSTNSTTATTPKKRLNSKKFIMDDGVIVVSPSTSMGHIEGRLRLCSRSVVFEPADPSRGIVRCPFYRMKSSPFLSPSSIPPESFSSSSQKNKKEMRRMTSSHLHYNNNDNSTSNNTTTTTENNEKMVAIVQCDRHYVMKTNNVIGPFTNVETNVEFRFMFLHSEPTKFFELSQTLFHMVKSKHHSSAESSSSSNNPTNTKPPPTLNEILRPILDRPFDPTNYVDARERPLTSNFRCSLLTPLLSKTGCVVVTNAYIYFQPTSGVFSTHASKAVSWCISDVVASARRYSGLKDCALELFFVKKGGGGYTGGGGGGGGYRGGITRNTSSTSSSSVLLAFETTRERERVLHLLPKHVPCHTDRSFVQAAYVSWKNSTISNFDYLLLLNSASGRTFHDLSRYPIFPWIISDYTSPKLDLSDTSIYRDLSKPIGAINEERLEYFRTRYNSMASDGHEDEAFLYGTHYSAPGYVLYYLIRNMPEHMLCLQNGKFDAPDRMFHSIDHTYSSALTNHTDVKELIPEFYSPSAGFDFLINARSLQLGTTQTGDRVHDVKLPPWAKSPRDYIKKNRAALESDICTAQLPLWIDLIFGCKSRGDSARDASNLFHRTAYLGPSDLESMKTEEEKMQAELQATEFGIVPDLLFCLSHPSKMGNGGGENDNDECDFIAPETGRAVIIEDMNDEDHHDHMRHTHHHHEAKTSAVDQPWELLDAPSTTQKSSTSNEDGLSLRIDHSWSSESMSSARAKNSGEEKKTPTTLNRKTKSSWSSSSGDVNGNHHDTAKPHRLATTPTTTDEFGAEIDRYNRFSSAAADQQSSTSIGSLSSSGRKLSLRGSGDAANRGERKHREFVSSNNAELNENRGGRQSSLSSSSSPFRGISQKITEFTKSSSSYSPARKKKPIPPSPPPPAAAESATASQGWELKPIASKNNMHGDSVSGCSLLLQEGIQHHSFLATVSLDGGLMVHTLPFLQDGGGENEEYQRRTFSSSSKASSISRFPYIGRSGGTSSASSAASRIKLNPYRSHTSSDPLACLVLTSDENGGHIVFAGGHDDVVLAYGINSGCALASVYSHRDAVTGIDLISRSSFGETKQSSTHIMVSGSWDATVKVWSVSLSSGETVAINREPLVELFDADSSIVSVSATEVNGSGVAICAGCDDGSLVIWMCHDGGKKEVIFKHAPKRGGGSCSAVKWVSSTLGYTEPILFAGFATGKLVSFALTDGGVIRPMSRIMLGSAVRCITAADGILLAGCADGSLQLIPVDYEGNLDTASRRWNSVNGSKSPSISCVGIAEDKESRSGTTRRHYVCSTGGDDGSVVLTKIKEL